MKNRIIGILFLLVISISMISLNFAFAGYLNINQTEDEVKEARYEGFLAPQGYNYHIVTGISESNPDNSTIIVNLTHNVDVQQIIYVDALMYNQTLGLGFSPNAGGPHPKGGEFDYGQFTIYFDDTNVYIYSPSPLLWGAFYRIVFFYSD